MPQAVKTDNYPQLAIVSLTESAANTLTFKKLETGVGVTAKVAWIISRIDYTIGSLLASFFGAAGDGLQWGLSVSNGFSVPALTEETIIDFNNIQRADFGTAASGGFVRNPLVTDYSMLPGGGILVPPNPLYLFAKGTTMEAASTVIARIWYSILELAPQDYLELLQARQVIES